MSRASSTFHAELARLRQSYQMEIDHLFDFHTQQSMNHDHDMIKERGLQITAAYAFYKAMCRMRHREGISWLGDMVCNKGHVEIRLPNGITVTCMWPDVCMRHNVVDSSTTQTILTINGKLIDESKTWFGTYHEVFNYVNGLSRVPSEHVR